MYSSVIAKTPKDPSRHARHLVAFRSARVAFRAILRALKSSSGKVLLPAYIGWSAREGSGVFDPIAELQLDYGFYALDEQLRIDMHSLRRELQRGCVRVLVIIHYFGYLDPSYAEAVKIARDHDVFVLEDEAHAMLSDIVGGSCGRLGDACIYSFHKMLPVDSGGAAVINDPSSPLVEKMVADPTCSLPLCDFDMNRIGEKRRANSLVLNGLVRELAPEITPLFGAPGKCEVPQTYPVMIRNGSRDRVYHEMNAAGYGVVSLYHTLISQLSTDRFPAAATVSRQVLNLPVHQDASEAALESMVRELAGRVRTT